MFISLLLVPVMALITMDDPGAIFTYQLDNAYGLGIDPNKHWFSLFTGVSFVTIISNLAWGLGYFGQPHIIVRFMALRKTSDARSGMVYGVGWMFLCMVGAVFVAIIGQHSSVWIQISRSPTSPASRRSSWTWVESCSTH